MSQFRLRRCLRRPARTSTRATHEQKIAGSIAGEIRGAQSFTQAPWEIGGGLRAGKFLPFDEQRRLSDGREIRKTDKVPFRSRANVHQGSGRFV